MKLQNEKFTANITAVDTKNLNLDNQSFIYFEENAKNEFSKSHIISVDNGTRVVQIILVGDLFLYDEHCAVLENEVLTVLQNNTLVQINLGTSQIIKQLIDTIILYIIFYKNQDAGKFRWLWVQNRLK